MGGRFRKREKPGEVTLEVGPGFRLVSNLNVEHRFSFVNFGQPFIGRVDGKYRGRFNLRLSSFAEAPLTWAADGQSLFAGGRGGLYRLDPANGAIEPLIQSEEATWQSSMGYLSCSRDGRDLAFVQCGTKGARFGIFDLETSKSRIVHEADKLQCLDIDWILRRAVFVAEGRKLLLVDIETGRVTETPFPTETSGNTAPYRELPLQFADNLTRANGQGILFRALHTNEVVSPDGSQVAHIHNEAELRLSSIDQPDRHERIAWMPGEQFKIERTVNILPNKTAWSPDGRLVGAELWKLARQEELTDMGRRIVESNPGLFQTEQELQQFHYEHIASKQVFVDLHTREVAVTDACGILLAFAP